MKANDIMVRSRVRGFIIMLMVISMWAFGKVEKEMGKAY